MKTEPAVSLATHNYRLLIQYDGGRYRGWQRLGDGQPTIQGRLEAVIGQLTGSEVQIIGSSRTDAGVHALAQVANFHTTLDLSPAAIKQHLDSFLPPDISVLAVSAVPDNFHARYQAKAKVYLYRIWNEPHSHPFLRRYSMHVKQPLDLASMQAAAQCFLGRHDFAAFSNAKSKKKTTEREIHTIELVRQAGMIEIRVQGNGFLYNMVRKMVGALIAVGLGELNASRIPELLQQAERGQIGAMAEAGGLYLEDVIF